MTTVDNPVEKVFKRWEEEAAKPICGKNYSMDMSKIPATFPYMRMMYMGGITTRGDLEGDECAITISFQIECFANGQNSLSKVYQMDDASHKCMVGMGFRRTYQNLIENSDNKIKRVVSRYSRIYTGQLLGEKVSSNDY